MDNKQAQTTVIELRGGSDSKTWVDPKHIATATFRDDVPAKLSRDPKLAESYSISLAEIWLTEPLPGIDEFEGIFNVDEVGLWYYDGDGSVEDPVWRQGVIPWRYVEALKLHQAS